jgi:hypothetical protein
MLNILSAISRNSAAACTPGRHRPHSRDPQSRCSARCPTLSPHTVHSWCTGDAARAVGPRDRAAETVGVVVLGTGSACFGDQVLVQVDVFGARGQRTEVGLLKRRQHPGAPETVASGI